MKRKLHTAPFRELMFIKFIAICTFFVSCEQNQVADRIYINGKIWTGDPSNEYSSSIGIKDSAFVFVGDEYENYEGDDTEIIDLEGKFVVPGFIDNHTHFLGGGFQLASVDLREASTTGEFVSILHDFTSSAPKGKWIQGGDWDHEAWGGQLPEKQWIDSVSADNPVFVTRYDGHMALANSAALELAGVTSATPDPPGGEIVRDSETGEPTGVLKDEAMGLVYQVLPSSSQEELDESLERAISHAFSNGVTQIHDMGSYGGWKDLETYMRAQKDGKLPLRVYSFVPLEDWEELDGFIQENGKGNNNLRWGGLKGFVDGSLGSTTAWFHDPYLDEPHTSGLVITDTTILRQRIRAADSADLHVAVHAIGDRANDWLLNVYGEVTEETEEQRRFRIEHAQHLSPEAIDKIAKLGVIPSMQPYHAIDDGRWAAKRLDDERLKGTYAFKSLLEHDARLTFGSDWTVGPLSPILGVYAAVTRRTLDDNNPDGWYPEQKLTVEEALVSYTSNNAYAGFMEEKTGVIKPGMLADFVVLSDDLFNIPAEDIKEVTVLRTVVDGVDVYIKE